MNKITLLLALILNLGYAEFSPGAVRVAIAGLTHGHVWRVFFNTWSILVGKIFINWKI